MSGPKCGAYRVVSAEELARRRLAAATDRYERSAASLAALDVDLGAAISTYGPLSVSIPRASRPLGNEASDWERAADELERGLESSRHHFEEAVAAARVRQFAAMAASITSSLPREAAHLRRAKTAAPDEEEIARVLGRMPLEATEHGTTRCEALAKHWREATVEQQRDQILIAIRLVVQDEQDRAHLIASNRRKVESLYRELDGLVGPPVEVVRGLLKGLDLAQPLPGDLERRAQEARDLAQAGQDRAYVLAAAAQALADLGYSLGPDFITAVPDKGGLIDLPHSGRHGLMVRERNHQLLMNVVRYDESGEREPADDAHSEELFCQDFSMLRARLRDQGVRLDMLRAEPPGSRPVQVLRRRPRREPEEKRATAQTAFRSREATT